MPQRKGAAAGGGAYWCDFWGIAPARVGHLPRRAAPGAENGRFSKGTTLANPGADSTIVPHTEEENMTTATARMTDLRIEVLGALAERPMFDNARIAAEEDDGIVTLTGLVDCYAKRLLAEETARDIAGVRGVINDIRIGRDAVFGWRDFDLIEGAGHILRSHYLLAGKRIVVAAHNGFLILSGRVGSLFERLEAERAVASLPTLQGIRNRIDVVPPKIETEVLRMRAVDAVRRVLGDDAESIDVRVTDRTVALVGFAGSWRDKVACRDAVSALRGVAEVEDLLEVY
jgi:osmotically-inducible protein OsmY